MKKITARPIKKNSNRGTCNIFGEQVKCSFGKKGTTNHKKEGDLKTPIGNFKILGIFYRKDRIRLPETKIRTRDITEDLIWISDPKHPDYNQPRYLNNLKTKPESFEYLMRKDHIYNIVLDLNFNRKNPKGKHGSAIFVHISRDPDNPHNSPTNGCIGLREEDIIKIIGKIDTETYFEIIENI